MIDYDKLIDDLDKVFNANSPSIRELDNLIKKYAKNQQMNIDYFINNGLEWNATASPEDVQMVLSELEALKKQVVQEEAGDMAGLTALCGIILNNLPYQTNADVCKLKARIDNVKLGIEANKQLTNEQKVVENKAIKAVKKDVPPVNSDLVQRVASYRGNGHYDPILRQRALLRVAYQNATAEMPLNLIFKHVQSLSMDLDNIIDYAVKNHINLNNLTTQYQDVLKAGQLNNLARGKWKTEVANDYMSTAANLKRIFVTECKARESQAALKEYQLQGYSKIRIITRHSKYVCKYCAQMDGTEVNIKDAKQGINIPPFHPNCFCHVEPVELDYDDVLNNLNDNSLNEFKAIKTKNNQFGVNNVVNTEKYHQKFNAMNFNKNVSESLYSEARKVLEHRNGTYYEDSVAIDSRTGEVLFNNQLSNKPFATGFLKKEIEAIKNNPNPVIIMHNHPGSSLPSDTDLKTMHKLENVSNSVVVGHDGTIYVADDDYKMNNFAKEYNKSYNKAIEKYQDKDVASNATVKSLAKYGKVNIHEY